MTDKSELILDTEYNFTDGFTYLWARRRIDVTELRESEQQALRDEMERLLLEEAGFITSDKLDRHHISWQQEDTRDDDHRLVSVVVTASLSVRGS